MAIASSIIGGVGALGSAIYGAVTSARANNKARQLIQKQRDDNRNWYNVKMAQDYTQRSDVQAAIKRQRELLDEQYKKARATNTVAGGTDEALALQKKAANAALAQTTTDIAAGATQYKDNVEQQYRNQDAALNQQQAQSYQQQAAQAAQAASQAVNAGIGLVGQGIQANAYNKVLESNEPQVVPTVNGFEVDTNAYNNAAAQQRMAQISQRYNNSYAKTDEMIKNNILNSNR